MVVGVSADGPQGEWRHTLDDRVRMEAYASLQDGPESLESHGAPFFPTLVFVAVTEV